MLSYAKFVRFCKLEITKYQAYFYKANDKEIQIPNHRKHILHYVDRMDTVGREIIEIYYVICKGHLNTFWIMVLYVKPYVTHN
jgi:hypothetical protein